MTEFHIGTGAILCAGFLALSFFPFYIKRCLLILQLSSYQLDGYWQGMWRGRKQLLSRCFFMALRISVVAMLLFPLNGLLFPLGTALMAYAFCLLTLALYRTKKRTEETGRQPLVYTPRIKRLCLVVFLSSLLLEGGSFVLSLSLWHGSPGVSWLTSFFLGILVFWILLPLWGSALLVDMSARLLHPLEKRINLGFVRDAQRILGERRDLIRIGITGSYGKTSTKFILGTILSEKYRVLVPPASYNTPMGMTRVIREMLLPTHQIIIGEMGARRKGEIKELCDILHPQYGLLTSIGPQHLETFHTISCVAQTKYELMESLPPGGMGFFFADGEWVERLYEAYPGNKCLFGTREKDPRYPIWAEDIRVGARGSEFTLVDKSGESIRCHTRLLGEHNIQNMLGCAALSKKLGLTLQEIGAGIEKVVPVEHRLELIDPQNGTLVIDDAFNSNPSGAHAALGVLSLFTQYRKICVTPGMIELGERQEEENRLFGEALGRVCDLVILVGERQIAPILEGLQRVSFPADGILSAKNLQEATGLLSQHFSAGDIVLFENDLPDHYNE